MNDDAIVTTNTTNDSAGLSRRTMIKTVGAGTAVIWAAPAISTLSSRAGAASAVCADGFSLCSDGPAPCGSSGPLAFCYCDTGAGGTTICTEEYFCGDIANHPECTQDSDCAAGWICANDGCNGCGAAGPGHCAAPCGSNIASTQSTGARSSGR